MCEYGFKEGMDYTPVIFDHPQREGRTLDFLSQQLREIWPNEKIELIFDVVKQFRGLVDAANYYK